jgi:LEA14-like dessication related protein
MMKISLFPALLTLVVLMTGCAKIQEPEFRSIDNFKVKELGLTQARIGFNVTYYNPNDFTMSVKETEADVYLDGVHLGKFVQDTLIEVGNKQNFSIPISGGVTLDKVMQLDLQNIDTRQVTVQATGSTRVGKAGIYITKPFSYQGKHTLNEIR